ncbi:hypothetical protein [Citrobacter werkmanii]|uniref:hypothetical protein n=1 Tax=Citrobacter werkmanii TaxID=67827 RepID=UPI000A24213E|nr:hypothetical protein [Citrobacter werkmanii]ORT71337.1 hypothetical protein BO998_21800 [Citrobacter werkmanii]
MKTALILLAILFMTGCNPDNYERDSYQWAVKFCGTEKEISSFEIYSSISNVVRCVDGRRASIPRGITHD